MPPGMIDENSWYAVHTRSKCEKSVDRDLADYCETYLPLQQVRRKWSDRVKTLEMPLIPSYVFVRLHEADRLRIYRHPNVIKILAFNGRPAPIPEKELDLVRRIESSKVPFKFSRNHSELHVGDKIIFNHGPLFGAEGIIDSFLNNSSVYIHVPTLGGFFIASTKDIAPHYSEMHVDSLQCVQGHS